MAIKEMEIDYKSSSMIVLFNSSDALHEAENLLKNHIGTKRRFITQGEMNKHIIWLMRANTNEAKIHAIRYYRSVTGAELWEAKGYVEMLKPESRPDRIIDDEHAPDYVKEML